MYEIFEMAKLTKQKSGQAFDIWVDSAGEDRKAGHNNIRVKAINNGVEVIAGFNKGKYTNFQTSPEALKKFGKARELKEYIIKIQPLLELHWKGKIDDGDLINAAMFVKQGYDVLTAIDKAIEMWSKYDKSI